MSDETDHASGTQGASAAEREIYMIACGQHADAHRAALERIAELEATVTRLTAPVGQDEATEAWNAWRMVEHPDEGMTSVLTAFLERRVTDPPAEAGGFPLPHHAAART